MLYLATANDAMKVYKTVHKARIFLLVDLRDFFFRFRVGGEGGEGGGGQKKIK